MSTSGNDGNLGTQELPWATLSKVNATSYAAGITVYLRRGDTWHEKLIASSDDVTYDRYGTGADPIIDGDDVRENLIDSNGKSRVTFRHIETKESRSNPDGGYGVRVEGGTGVVVEDVTIRTAGKHALGAIETYNFTARRVKGYDLQAGLGFGAATTFVSYGDTGSGQDHTWEDCESTTGSSDYPSFITHGVAVRSVILDNLVEHTPGAGSNVSQYSTSPLTRLQVIGGTHNGINIQGGVGTLIDGATVNGLAYLGGTDHILRNSTVTDLATDWHGGRPAVVILAGTGSIVEDNVITTALDQVDGGAVAIGPVGNGTVRRNQLVGPIAIRVQYDGAITGLTSNNNVWCSIGAAQQGSVAQTGYTLPQWKVLGFDVASTTQVCP